MTTVVFDLETTDKISDMPGTDRDDQVKMLQVSCACALVVDSEALLDPARAAAAVEEGEMHTFWRDRGLHPLEELLELFDKAEVIASYNGLGFDHPVLLKYYESRTRYQSHVLKSHDAFQRLRDITTFWYKLDDLLKANGLETKTATGLQAITWWYEGKRDEIEEYCRGDVLSCARLLAMPQIHLPQTTTVVPNYVFGVASAIAAVRASTRLAQQTASHTQKTGEEGAEAAV